MVQSTPQPQQPRWMQTARRRLVSLIIGMGLFALGFFTGSWIAGVTRSDASAPIGLPLLIVIAGLSVFGVILAHELGHVLGGRLAGFRFRLLIVGPLKIDRNGARLRIGLNRSLALAGGLAAASPADDRDLRRRMLIYVAGGPATSLLLGAGALLVRPLLSGVPALTLSLIGFASLMIALVTLIPMRAGGFSSDGARILMLLRGGPEAERWCAVAILANDLFATRPRDLAPALIERSLALADNTPDHLSSVFVAYGWALDRGDIPAAEGYLETMLANLSAFNSALRPSVLIEAAYFTARHHTDAAAARALLDQAHGGLVEPYTRARAEAAVLLAEGRPAEAQTLAAQGLRQARRVAGAATQVDIDLLEAIVRASDGKDSDR